MTHKFDISDFLNQLSVGNRNNLLFEYLFQIENSLGRSLEDFCRLEGKGKEEQKRAFYAKNPLEKSLRRPRCQTYRLKNQIYFRNLVELTQYLE